MRYRNQPYRSRNDLLSYLLSGVVIYGLSVLTLHFNLANDLTGLITSIASNPTSSM